MKARAVFYRAIPVNQRVRYRRIDARPDQRYWPKLVEIDAKHRAMPGRKTIVDGLPHLVLAVGYEGLARVPVIHVAANGRNV